MASLIVYNGVIVYGDGGYMRLFDKIRAPFVSSDTKEVAPQAEFPTRAGGVYAPLTGMLVTLEEVADQTIAQGLMGEGVGIVPIGLGYVYAPCAGRISHTTVTNHSIGLTTDTGVNILIHVGIDTVKMEGRGFKRYVEANQDVKAGDPLMHFDREAVRAAGYDDTVVMVITNADETKRIDFVGASSTLIGGRPLVKTGDCLMMVNN